MKRAIILFIALAGCATPAPPEPIVITKEVKVAVAVPCKPTLPARPNLMTKEQIKAVIAVAQSLDDKVKIVTEQLLLYVGWVPVVEAALDGCGKVPVPEPTSGGN